MGSHLGLDLATEAGAASWKPGLQWPRAFLVNLPKGADTGLWLWELYQWGIGFCRLEEVTDIAVETPLIGMGGEEKNFKLIGAAGVMRMIGAQLTDERRAAGGPVCQVTLIANSTMFSHFVGSNNFTGDERKNRSIMSCHLRGMGKVSNHNVADAIGVLTYRLHMLRLHKEVPWDIQKGAANTLFEGKPGVRIDASNQKAATALMQRSAINFERERS